MKNTDILLGVEYYYRDTKDWAQPEWTHPQEKPVVRLDEKRYRAPDTWARDFNYVEDTKGGYIRCRYVGGSADVYLRPQHLHGPFDEVYAQVKAFCDERDAKRKAEADERAAQQSELVELARLVSVHVNPDGRPMLLDARQGRRLILSDGPTATVDRQFLRYTLATVRQHARDLEEAHAEVERLVDQCDQLRVSLNEATAERPVLY